MRDNAVITYIKVLFSFIDLGSDNMEFSENTRVKIPAIVHATRLGYDYISLKDKKDSNV